MAKTKKIVKLHGVMKNGSKANTNQAAKVVAFTNDSTSIRIINITDKTCTLWTAKNHYEMHKHPTQNYYQGTLPGHLTTNSPTKVQVHLKKIAGNVTYWA